MKQFLFYLSAVAIGALLSFPEIKMFAVEILFFALGYAVSYFWGRPTPRAADAASLSSAEVTGDNSRRG